MSMVLDLCRASDATLRALLADPQLDKLLAFLHREPETERTDLEKAWHGLHWLLTGTFDEGNEPLCYLVTGGHQIGTVSLTYGPARALFRHEVVAFHEALSALPPETLAERYDPEAMMEEHIYPEIWDRDPNEEDNRAYLMFHYRELRQFVAETCRKGLGLFLYLT